MLDVVERFNPECPLNLMIDYIRIKFLEIDVKTVIESFMQLRFSNMVHEKGFFGYNDLYRYGNIMVLASPGDGSKRVLIELRGKGCREFENVLFAQSREWWDFLGDCYMANCVFRRVDLAVNDVHGILDIGELIKKTKTEECITLFRTYNVYASGELTNETENLGMGKTLYLGSMRSELYFCIYEKDYEQFVKAGVPIDEAPIKNRFEIRLSKERAEKAILDLMSMQDYEGTVFGIINEYVKFIDIDPKKKRKDRQKENERWEHFIGKNREKLKLTTQPEPYTYDRTVRWVTNQVAPSIKLLKKIDKHNGTNLFEEIIENTNLSDKHEKIFYQQTKPVEEMIIKDNGKKEL